METMELQMECKLWERLKAMITKDNPDIKFEEGEQVESDDPFEPVMCITIRFDYPDENEFSGLVSRAINREYDLM